MPSAVAGGLCAEERDALMQVQAAGGPGRGIKAGRPGWRRPHGGAVMGLTVCENGSLDAVWLLGWVWGEREESGGMVVPLAHCRGGASDRVWHPEGQTKGSWKSEA